jgi:septum formation protein
MTFKLFLASESPRRQQLLKEFGVSFSVIPNRLDKERLPTKGSLSYKIRTLSKQKAIASKENYKGLILTADTVISFNNEILGKPNSPSDAEHMLKRLSGNTHTIITAFSVLNTIDHICISRSSTATLTFNTLSTSDIKSYISEKKPFDKAGSYGIQDIPTHFLNSFTGSYNTIMGLPIKYVLKILNKYDIV